jgi:hypothetical protein
MSRQTKVASEIWKEIAGYAGLYDVSNMGRVRSYHTLVSTATVIFHPRRQRYFPV